jgi:hypothetical protein
MCIDIISHVWTDMASSGSSSSSSVSLMFSDPSDISMETDATFSAQCLAGVWTENTRRRKPSHEPRTNYRYPVAGDLSLRCEGTDPLDRTRITARTEPGHSSLAWTEASRICDVSYASTLLPQRQMTYRRKTFTRRPRKREVLWWWWISNFEFCGTFKLSKS